MASFFPLHFSVLLLLLFHHVGSAQFTVDSATVGLWHCDEGVGLTVSDATGHGNTGTLNNPAAWAQSGRFGPCIRFNGTANHVLVPPLASQNLGSAITIEAWINVVAYPAAGHTGIIMHKGALNDLLPESWLLEILPDGRVHFSSQRDEGCGGIGDSWIDVTSASSLIPGNWHNVMATYDEATDTAKIWIDAHPEGTAFSLHDLETCTVPLNIGATTFLDQPVECFNGYIDEIRLSNIARTVEPVLPVQLAWLRAVQVATRRTAIRWMTLSETNNYGFVVQREGMQGGFVDLPGAFVPGHGTTTTTHTYEFTDQESVRDAVRYRLKQVDLDGTIHYTEATGLQTGVSQAGVARSFSLGQNYPNPFNPATTIPFDIPESGNVTLRIHTILGEEVATLVDGFMTEGPHAVLFDASALPTGVYVCRLEASGLETTRKLVVVR